MESTSRDAEGVKEMNYCFYFLGGILFVSGVSVLANTTDDNSILFGAIMIILGTGSYYIGSKIDE